MSELNAYIELLLRRCAADRGGRLAELDVRKVSERLHESDAALFRRGLENGLLSVDERAYLHTADPHQATAWLVEGGAAAWPCWEYLPHAASYVELILDRGYPSENVRFETPGSEHKMDLDLAVVDADGRVVVVGEAKKTSKELDSLLNALPPHFAANPGYPTGVRGPAQAAWKLAYRLWATRAAWLWLIGPSDRRAYGVAYTDTIELTPEASLPRAPELGITPATTGHPLIQLPANPSPELTEELT